VRDDLIPLLERTGPRRVVEGECDERHHTAPIESIAVVEKNGPSPRQPGDNWRRSGRPAGGLETVDGPGNTRLSRPPSQHRSLDLADPNYPHRSKQGTFGFCPSCHTLPGKRCGRGSLGHLSLRPLRQRSNPQHAVIEGRGNGWPWRLHHPGYQVRSNRLPNRLPSRSLLWLEAVHDDAMRDAGLFCSPDEAVVGWDSRSRSRHAASYLSFQVRRFQKPSSDIIPRCSRHQNGLSRPCGDACLWHFV
jgi:hypothetical protein